MDEQDKAKPPAQTPPKPNVSVRAVIVKDDKLLVVNGDGAGDRITSYNVCYTKLLRGSHFGAAFTVFDDVA